MHFSHVALPWLPCVPSHQYCIAGGCLLLGNTLSGDHPGVPLLEIHQYICFTLYKHCFIGPFEKHAQKNIENKIK